MTEAKKLSDVLPQAVRISTLGVRRYRIMGRLGIWERSPPADGAVLATTDGIRGHFVRDLDLELDVTCALTFELPPQVAEGEAT